MGMSSGFPAFDFQQGRQEPRHSSAVRLHRLSDNEALGCVRETAEVKTYLESGNH